MCYNKVSEKDFSAAIQNLIKKEGREMITEERNTGKAILLVVALIVLVVLVLWPSPKATVASATIPGTTMDSGDSAIIYRFAVSAEGADVKIEQIYLTFSQGVSFTNLRFYDDGGMWLSGALYYSSKGMIRYWPGWPLEAKIVIPEGTTKIFNLRGNVVGHGAVTIKIEDFIIEDGSVEGLPTIITTLLVK